MFHYSLAYHHQNGDVEGFAANTFLKESGEAACIAKIARKCGDIGQFFDPARIIRSFDGLTPAEKDSILRDWRCDR